MKCGCKGKCACKGKSSKQTPRYEKGGKVMKTTPTADGGQQYVRGDTLKAQAKTVDTAKKVAGAQRYTAMAGTRAGTDMAEERRAKHNAISGGLTNARKNLTSKR